MYRMNAFKLSVPCIGYMCAFISQVSFHLIIKIRLT